MCCGVACGLTSEMTVAMAAPATPRCALKMSMGSKTRLIRLEERLTLSGVTTSRQARKAAKATDEAMAAIKLSERSCR